MKMRNRIVLCAMMFLGLTVFGTVGYWYFSRNWLDSLYMTLITVATIGYGEIIDMSNNPAARIFTMVLIVMSMGVIAVVTSMLAASILEVELSGFFRRRKVTREIAKLCNHYIICGAGVTGNHVISELIKAQRPLVVIDHNAERLEKTAEQFKGLLYIKGDATEDDVLLAAGVERAAGVIATLPSDKDNLYIVVATRQFNATTRVVVRGVEDKAVGKLKKAGADSIVSASRIGGMRIASETIRPSVVKFLDTMLRQTNVTVRIEEIPVEPGSRLAGKRLGDFPLLDKYGLQVIAVMKPGMEEVVYTPPSDMVLVERSVVVVIGDVNKVIQAKAEICGETCPGGAVKETA
jgi:voltage-gated potassium channel